MRCSCGTEVNTRPRNGRHSCGNCGASWQAEAPGVAAGELGDALAALRRLGGSVVELTPYPGGGGQVTVAARGVQVTTVAVQDDGMLVDAIGRLQRAVAAAEAP